MAVKTTKTPPSVAITMFSRFGSKLDDADQEQNHDNDHDHADDSDATTSCVHLDLPLNDRITAVDLCHVRSWPIVPRLGLEWVDPGSRCYCRPGPGRDEGYREEAEDHDKRHRHKNEAAQRR